MLYGSSVECTGLYCNEIVAKSCVIYSACYPWVIKLLIYKFDVLVVSYEYGKILYNPS